jgi:TPR repeat protein
MEESKLKEAELLLDSASYSASEKRYKIIIKLVREILKPYIKKKHPSALWLKASMPNLGEKKILSNEQFEKKRLSLVKKAAFGGCKEAQYDYGCELYNKKAYVKALKFYKKSAKQGYAPAQWCFGLDTVYGIGVDKDQEKGLYYIRLSAEQRYEFAVDFLIRNYKEGNFGLKKDLKEIMKWDGIRKFIE